MAVLRGTTRQRSSTNFPANRHWICANLTLRHHCLLFLLVKLLEIDFTTRARRDRLNEERTECAISKMTFFLASMTTTIKNAITDCFTRELLVRWVVDGARHMALRLPTATYLFNQN
jgi:hypothetical protein